MANCSYFSHDCNARNDEKILAVRMRHGAEGYAVFFMILERLRDTPDYTSVKDYNSIAFDLRVSAGLVKSVVEDFGLFTFTDDGKRFYSEGFSKRMKLKDDVRKSRAMAASVAAKKRWEPKQGEKAEDPQTKGQAPKSLPTEDVHYSDDLVESMNEIVACFQKKNPSLLGGLPQHLHKLAELWNILQKNGGNPRDQIRKALEKMEQSKPIKSGKFILTLDSFLKPEIFAKLYNGDYDADYSAPKAKKRANREAGLVFGDLQY